MGSIRWDAPVLLHKTSAMQSIADYVRSGYTCATQGMVGIERAQAFARKFRDLYLVHLGKDARYRRKKMRLGNAALVLWQHDERAPILTWILLVTPPELQHPHPAHTLEQLTDVMSRRGRIVLDSYELVRATRRGAMRPSWTWRLTRQATLRWRDRLSDAIRSRDFVRLRQSWYSLHRMPGFAPIRAQARQLRTHARDEWKRSMGSGHFPCADSRIWYVSRHTHEAAPLSSLVHRWMSLGANLRAERGGTECQLPRPA